MSRFTIMLLLIGLSTAAFAHRLSTLDGPTTEAIPACAENGQLPTAQDSLPPTITCPPSVTLTVSGTACDTAYQYTVTAEDDAPGVILAMVSGIASGGIFPAGTTTNLYIAIDGAGHTATCSFSVQVNTNVPSSLSCRTLPTLSLNSVCSLQVYASDLLLPPFGCNNAYSVEVDRTLPFGNGPWVPALFGPNDRGKTYQCRITNLTNGNKCWSNIILADSLPPALVCPTVDIPCALPSEHLLPTFLKDSLGLLAGRPTVLDNCPGNATFSFLDEYADVPCGAPDGVTGTIARSWIVADVSGNSTTCVQTINRVRTLDNVHFPEDAEVFCSAPDVAPARTGAPYATVGARQYSLITAPFCEIDAFYSDSIESTCGGGWRIRRVWEVRDACLPTGPSNPLVGTQYIEVRDHAKPIAQCPADTLLVLVADDSCRTIAQLPDVVVHDACSPVTEATASWIADGTPVTLHGTLADVGANAPTGHDTLAVFGVVPDFPTGITEVHYVLSDACGNTTTCVFRMEIWDTEPPTAACDSLVVVALDESGRAVLLATAVDDGSSDACGDVYFKIRRADTIPDCDVHATDFSNSLILCCVDVGDTIEAVLRVYDVPLPSGAVSDSFAVGHFSDCHFALTVIDYFPSTCTAPPDVQTFCYAFDPSLEAYGAFTYSCRVDSIIAATDYSEMDTVCRAGTIIRHFEVVETATGQSAACSQRIVVNLLPQIYYIRFPDDRIAPQCDPNASYGQPALLTASCEQMEVTYTDEIITVVPDACLRINRTWTVRNRCTFDPDKPLISVPNPNPNAVANHPNNLPGPVVSPPNAFGSWAPTKVAISPGKLPTNFSTFWAADANGYTYTQTIKILDNQKPVVADCPAVPFTVEDASSNDVYLWHAPHWLNPNNNQHDLCEAEVDLCLTATDQCVGADVSIRYLLFLDLDGDNTQETVVNSQTAFTANRVFFNNAKNAGYTGGIQRQFDFREVPAEEKYGFALQTSTDGNNKTACVRWRTTNDPLHYVLPQLPHGTHRIRWIVSDNCGNETTCEQTFTVQNSTGGCDFSDVPISGDIRTETGLGVADVAVTLNRTLTNQPPWTGETYTDNDGHFTMQVPAGGYYSVRPERDMDPLNGVSTLDLLLINKHILGLDTLDSPYKQIAADVNNSRSITTFDVLELRKLVLGLYQLLPNNTSWRFVDAGYSFTSPNPFIVPFPEVQHGFHLSPLNPPPVHHFIGVKIGDVNNSVSLTDAPVEARTVGTLLLDVPDRTVRAGEAFDVPLALAETVSGVQFALALTGLEVLEVLPGPGMGAEHFALFPDEGLLAVSWTGEGAPAFSLRLRAKGAGQLCEMLRLSNRNGIRPEAYQPNGNAYRTSALALRFDGTAVHPPGIELFQNRPNPFGAATEIGFYLPEAKTATLRVFDATGRERYAHTAPRTAGMHAVVLTRTMLGEASGVLYYVLETDRERVVKKMVVE